MNLSSLRYPKMPLNDSKKMCFVVVVDVVLEVLLFELTSGAPKIS